MAISQLKKKAEEERGEDSKMNLVKRQKKQAFDVFKVIFRLAFSNLGMLILNIIYAAGGAKIFMALELPGEAQRYADKQDVAKKLNATVEYLAFSFYNSLKNPDPSKNLGKAAFEDMAFNNLQIYVTNLVDALDNNNYDGTVDGWYWAWNFPNTLLFTLSIMTTIGYGQIAPKSFFGQMFVIIYALIGMPLLMVFLGNLGGLMADAIKLTYSRLCCRWCRARRLVSERVPGMNPKKYKKLIDEVVGDEDYMPTDQIEIPIILLVSTILFFLLVGAYAFNFWEDWTLTVAGYFSFVTLSTIGFGDYYPITSFQGFDQNLQGKLKACGAIVYCCLGVAFLAMNISLIQENVMLKTDRVKKSLGLQNKKQLEIEPVTVKERLTRNSKGEFVGLSADHEDSVEVIVSEMDTARRDSVVTRDMTEVTETEDVAALPGQVENDDAVEELEELEEDTNKEEQDQVEEEEQQPEDEQEEAKEEGEGGEEEQPEQEQGKEEEYEED